MRGASSLQLEMAKACVDDKLPVSHIDTDMCFVFCVLQSLGPRAAFGGHDLRFPSHPSMHSSSAPLSPKRATTTRAILARLPLIGTLNSNSAWSTHVTAVRFSRTSVLLFVSGVSAQGPVLRLWPLDFLFDLPALRRLTYPRENAQASFPSHIQNPSVYHRQKLAINAPRCPARPRAEPSVSPQTSSV